MQTISLPYGRDRVEAQIPDQRLAAVLRSGAQSYRPQADQAQLVRQALENPIGTPRSGNWPKASIRLSLSAAITPARSPARLFCPSW